MQVRFAPNFSRLGLHQHNLHKTGLDLRVKGSDTIFDILTKIKEDWDKGKPILLYDSDKREGEIDMMFPSELVVPAHVAQMRNDAGGLICVALSDEHCKKIQLPFIATVYENVRNLYPVVGMMSDHGLPYGARSSFSLNVNHVKAFTGITDEDRALTISELGSEARKFQEGMGKEDLLKSFGSNFRLPGHVPLLRGAAGLLKSRLGHTELGLALCELTKNAPSVVMCEMMDAETFKATSLKKARKYAEEHDLVLVDGNTVINLWCAIKKIPKRDIYQPPYLKR